MPNMQGMEPTVPFRMHFRCESGMGRLVTCHQGAKGVIQRSSSTPVVTKSYCSSSGRLQQIFRDLSRIGLGPALNLQRMSENWREAKNSDFWLLTTHEFLRLVQTSNMEDAVSRCFPRLGRGDCLRGVVLVPLRLHSLFVLCQQVARLKFTEHVLSRAHGR